MKRWQKKKLRNELAAIIVAIVGAILVITHLFDECPWIALVGFAIVIVGIFAFAEIRETKNSKYQKRYPEKTR